MYYYNINCFILSYHATPRVIDGTRHYCTKFSPLNSATEVMFFFSIIIIILYTLV